MPLNSLPNDKFLDWSKFKGFADDVEIMISAFNRVENVVRKGENAGFQHLLFPHCFQKASLSGFNVKSRDFVVKSLSSKDLTLSSIYAHFNTLNKQEDHDGPILLT